MAKPATGAIDAQRMTIAEALVGGEAEDAIVSRMAAHGMAAATARYEIERARKSPFLAVAQRAEARLAKRDWTMATLASLSALDEAQRTIPTAHAIDPERFGRDFYAANRPVKLTGLVDHWPALERWSIDHFEAAIGDAPVELQLDRETEAGYEIDKDRHRGRIGFASVAATLREKGPSNNFYLTAYNSGANRDALAPLWQDLGPVSLLSPRDGQDGYFWLGPAGTLTPFHHDLTNNLLVQVLGRKRVKMVSPLESPLMRNHIHCFSAWDGGALEAGDPAPGKPRVLETVIGPGEAIFLPIGWWHHVEALDVSASMSFTNFRWPNDFVAGYRSYGPM